MINFLYAGIATVAGGAGIASVFSLRNPESLQKDVNQVKGKENLTVDVDVTSSYDSLTSTASLYQDSTKASINISPITTNLSKIYAPISSMKSDSELFDDLILYHELAHTELHNMIKQKQKPFSPQLDSNLSSMNNTESALHDIFNFDFFTTKISQNILLSNFHEQFADTYGSLLLIRNKSPEHSDDKIKKSIQARHDIIESQETILWGATGSLAHRTENSLKKVLSLDFDKIKNLSPEETKDLALKIASNSTLEKYPQAYESKSIYYSKLSKDIDRETVEHISSLKPDNSFLEQYQKPFVKPTLNIASEKLAILESQHNESINNSLESKLSKVNSLIEKNSEHKQPSIQPKLY